MTDQAKSVSELVSGGVAFVPMVRNMAFAREPTNVSYRVIAAWEEWLTQHGGELSHECLTSIGESMDRSIALVERMIAAGMPERLAWQFLPYGLHRNIDIGNFVQGGIRYGLDE